MWFFVAQLYKVFEQRKKKVRVTDRRVVFLGQWQAVCAEEALKPKIKGCHCGTKTVEGKLFPAAQGSWDELADERG